MPPVIEPLIFEISPNGDPDLMDLAASSNRSCNACAVCDYELLWLSCALPFVNARLVDI